MQPAMLSVTVARGSRGCAQPRLIMILSRERYPCALESTCDIESMLGVAREEVLASPQAPERLTLSVHPRGRARYPVSPRRRGRVHACRADTP